MTNEKHSISLESRPASAAMPHPQTAYGPMTFAEFADAGRTIIYGVMFLCIFVGIPLWAWIVFESNLGFGVFLTTLFLTIIIDPRE